MIRAQGGAERRGVAWRDAHELGVEHIGDHLQDVVLAAAPPVARIARPSRRDPARVQPHRHRLRLDHRPDGARRVGRIDVLPARSGLGTCGVISGTNHGAIRPPPLPAGVRAEPPRSRPSPAVHVAHALARQRAVGEAGERHVAAGRRAEDVPGALRIVRRPRDGAEHRVARAERDAELPGVDQAEADERGGIVARPRRSPSRDRTRTSAASTAPARRRRSTNRAIGGRRRARSGAVASSAAGDHAARARSIRFIPAPSPGSIGA